MQGCRLRHRQRKKCPGNRGKNGEKIIMHFCPGTILPLQLQILLESNAHECQIIIHNNFDKYKLL